MASAERASAILCKDKNKVSFHCDNLHIFVASTAIFYISFCAGIVTYEGIIRDRY